MRYSSFIFRLSAVAALLLTACARIETARPDQQAAGPDDFTVYLDQSSSRIYLGSDGSIRWASFGGDTLSVFTPGLHSAYVSTVLSPEYPGRSTSVVITKVDGADISTGVSGLSANYAVYPYPRSDSIEEQGILHTGFYNAPLFVAATDGHDDHVLYLKAACSYLVIPIYGSGLVTGFKFRGNNGETIAGPADITVRYDAAPAIAMHAGGTTEINTNYSSPENLTEDYPDADHAMSLVYYLPPTVFSQGFTLVVIDAQGNEIPIVSQESRTLARNVVNRLEPVRVDAALYAPYASVDEAKAAFDAILKQVGEPFATLNSNRHDDFDALWPGQGA